MMVEWEIIVEVARFFKGALSIPDMLEMKFKEIYFWYKLEERKIIEQNIITEKQSEDADRPLPTTAELRRMVNKEIKKREDEVKELYGR